MSNLILNSSNRALLADALASERWVVACLCAAWCDSCGAYQATFEALAQGHPDKSFIWIDIEDQADLVGELDVENFPTLLIQQADLVAFFGCVQPDLRLADRLIRAQTDKSRAELRDEADSSIERRRWQAECNLGRRLHQSSGNSTR